MVRVRRCKWEESMATTVTTRGALRLNKRKHCARDPGYQCHRVFYCCEMGQGLGRKRGVTTDEDDRGLYTTLSGADLVIAAGASLLHMDSSGDLSAY